jgi:uncharacterized protein YciI
MGKNDKFNERKTSSYKRELKGAELKQGKKEDRIVFSFRDFDRTQGQNFEEWEEEKILAKAVNKLRDISQLTRIQATTQQIIKQYSNVNFPPNTAFEHPKHVLPDIVWCSVHIQGKECIIGHFEDNVFHIVFLDKNHEFWISKKKNT